MAKQVKLTLNGGQVYPQTITDAIADLNKKKKLSTIISETDTALDNLEKADHLASPITASVAVGKVAQGSTFAEGTDVRDVLNAVLAFETPTFSSLTVTIGGANVTASTNYICESTNTTITAVKHKEANIGSISSAKLSMNGTEETITPTATEATITKNVSVARATNKASYAVTLKGTNTLGAAMANKSITFGWYMPVVCYVSADQTEATIKAGLASATPETTAHVGVQTINKTATIAKGGAWCIALPSHLDLTAIGTQADFGFGTQKTSGFTSYTATRTINGIANVAYTIYVFPCDTAQTNLPVRATTKAK